MSRDEQLARNAEVVLNPGGIHYSGYPGGVVFPGRAEVFFLAVCPTCDPTKPRPFHDVVARDQWTVAHPHDVRVGVEVRCHQSMTGEDAPT